MELLSSILYFPVGFLYLWIRYRNKQIIKKVLKEKYNSSYYEAGFLSVGKVFGAVFLSLIILVLITVLTLIVLDWLK